MRREVVFPGIVEEVDGWSTKRFVNLEAVKSSSEYLKLLKRLETASKLLKEAYTIVCYVKEDALCSDGKSELMTVEDLLSGNMTPEELLDILLGIK